MNCPNCGIELVEKFERIIIEHPFGRSKRTLKDKTKKTRVFFCPHCLKNYALKLDLKEVKMPEHSQHV